MQPVHTPTTQAEPAARPIRRAYPSHRPVANSRTLTALRSLTPNRPIHRSEHARIAELQANRLRKLLGVDSPVLLTEQVAELPFLDVRYDEELHTSGMSFWSGQRWIILLNPNEPETRQRFTLLHELHHVICHRDRQRFFGSTTGHSPDAERMADAFAGFALMPKLYVKRLYGQGHRTPEVLAEHFAVSVPAMTYRLDNLALAVPGRRCGYSRATVARHVGGRS